MSYLTDGIRRGTFANRPTTAPDGTVYVCTDSPLQFVFKSGVWNSYLGSQPLNTPPAASTWQLINAVSGSTFIDSQGGLVFNASMAAGTQHVAKVAAPATPYSITAHFIPNWSAGVNPSALNFAVAGVCWRDSGTGNLHIWGTCMATTVSGTYITIYRVLTASSNGSTGITYSNTTDTNNFTQIFSQLAGYGVWVRGTDDGTNRTVWFSNDGVNFAQWGSIARTSGIANPNEVGIFAGNFASGGTVTPYTLFTSVKIG